MTTTSVVETGRKKVIVWWSAVSKKEVVTSEYLLPSGSAADMARDHGVWNENRP